MEPLRPPESVPFRAPLPFDPSGFWKERRKQARATGPRSRLKGFFWQVLFLALLGGSLGLPPLEARQPRADNVLIVSLDTVRADHMGLYGYSRPTTSAIDAWSQRGVVFTSAVSHVPSTLPAHCTILTGLLPPEHGVRCNGLFRLPESVTTLAEILRKRGFATGAIVGALPLDHRFGLAQGFVTYDDDFGTRILDAPRTPSTRPAPGVWLEHQYTAFERRADEVTERALRWLEHRTSPWFLFVHYFDAHHPYEPDAPWSEQFPLPYDGELAFVDHHLGRLLDRVRALEGRTLIVLTADHGESLGEHGEATHNRFLYNATQWVPLVMVLEGVIPAGKRIDAPVCHADILPTVLSFLDLRPPRGLSGVSLRAPILGDEPVPNRAIYAETMVWKLENLKGIEVRALLFGPLKMIWTRTVVHGGAPDQWEAYEWRLDPHELDNVFSSEAVSHRILSERLVKLSARFETHAPQPEPVVLDSNRLKQLRNLGYLGGK